MRTFVVGDIHGAYKALCQCFERSGFDKDNDRLIVLGDVCDGYSQVKEVIDELLSLKHCVFIIGNHDIMALNWLTTGFQESYWMDEGGAATANAYAKGAPDKHIQFLKNGKFWFEDAGDIFVHGGFDPSVALENQDKLDLVWDRKLILDAVNRSKNGGSYQYAPWKRIFLGHTPTYNFGISTPMKACNILDLDTGAGWSGALSIMDVATEGFWQSDKTQLLYPHERARNRKS